MSDDLAFRAMEYARLAHRTQVRKYTGNLYIEHPAEVAGLVASVMSRRRMISEIAIATAWLHDTIEDQGKTHQELAELFGKHVAMGVLALSDIEQGNRAERKAQARFRLSTVSGWIQTIKVADVISNTSSIVKHDPKFARVYLREIKDLLPILREADKRLLLIANEQVAEAANLLYSTV